MTAFKERRRRLQGAGTGGQHDNVRDGWARGAAPDTRSAMKEKRKKGRAEVTVLQLSSTLVALAYTITFRNAGLTRPRAKKRRSHGGRQRRQKQSGTRGQLRIKMPRRQACSPASPQAGRRCGRQEQKRQGGRSGHGFGNPPGGTPAAQKRAAQAGNASGGAARGGAGTSKHVWRARQAARYGACWGNRGRRRSRACARKRDPARGCKMPARENKKGIGISLLPPAYPPSVSLSPCGMQQNKRTRTCGRRRGGGRGGRGGAARSGAQGQRNDSTAVVLEGGRSCVCVWCCPLRATRLVSCVSPRRWCGCGGGALTGTRCSAPPCWT